MAKQAHFEVFQSSNEHAMFSFWRGIQNWPCIWNLTPTVKILVYISPICDPQQIQLYAHDWLRGGVIVTRHEGFQKYDLTYRGVGAFDLILPSHAHCRGRRDCDCVFLILLHPAHDGAAVVNVLDSLWLASVPPCWSFPCRCGCLGDSNA